MKYLSLLVTIPMVVLSALFIFANKDRVDVAYWVWSPPLEVPLYVVGISMLCLGFLFGALFVSLSFYALKHEHWKTKRKLARLENEFLKQQTDQGISKNKIEHSALSNSTAITDIRKIAS